MDAGRLDNRATFTKRANQSAIAGNVRTDSLTPWLHVHASFRPVSGAEQAENGVLQDVTQAIVRVRDTADTRKINHSMRIKIKDFDWAIKSVMPPDRRTGLIEMSIERKNAG